MSLLRRRSSHRDEHGFAGFHRGSQIIGKSEIAAAMPLHQFRQELFVNRNLSVLERRQFVLVIVDKDDVVSHVRKTRPRHQSHIPRPNYRDVHPNLPISSCTEKNDRSRQLDSSVRKYASASGQE